MRTKSVAGMVVVVCACASVCAAWVQPERDRGAVSGEAELGRGLEPRDALGLRLDEIDERLGKIEQMRARFGQTRTIPMLRRPMESSGTVMLKDGAIRWDTLKPAASTMLVREGEIQLYYPESAILEIYQAGDADLPVQAQGGDGGSLRFSQLRERFEITEISAARFGERERAELLGLELVPLEGDDEEPGLGVEVVRVLIDTGIPMIRRIQITSAEGEITEIELHDIRLDKVIRASEMEIVVPAGTLISRPMEGELGRGETDEGAGDPAGDGSP